MAWGGVVPSFGATKWNDEKKRDGWGLGLGQLPIDDFPHNNQPKIGVSGMEGSMKGRCHEREVRGKRNFIVLGALEVDMR
jgi:hypothetical protein